MAMEKKVYFVDHVHNDHHRSDGSWSIIQLKEFSKPDADRKVELRREIDGLLKDYTPADVEALRRLHFEQDTINCRGRTVINFANTQRVLDYAKRKGLATAKNGLPSATDVLPRDTILEEIPPFFKSEPGNMVDDSVGLLAKAKNFAMDLVRIVRTRKP